MLKIKLLHPDAKVPTRSNETDAGLDLYCYKQHGPFLLASGQIASFRTGVAVSMPTGFVGNIRPRSGLAVKWGIDVLAGTVDSSYRGEVLVVLINLGQEPCVFKHGDRIAQLVIQKIELWNPAVVDELDETERGENGFGSSGK